VKSNKTPTDVPGIPQPFNRPLGQARQVKPVSAQLKAEVSAQGFKQAVAPTAFRAQATPKAAQPKMANGAVKRKLPVAPPVYRPQTMPKVLQTKASSGQGPLGGPAPRHPVAPPVYRPEAKKIVQPKAISPQQKSPSPPPVYRPEQKRIAQPKMSSPAQAHLPPKIPLISRPQPKHANGPTVVQRAEKRDQPSMLYRLGSFVAPRIATIFQIPNYFEMPKFTSCICLVFNRAGMSMNEVMKISGDYEATFDQIKQKWKEGGADRPFRAICPYDNDGLVSSEFKSFCQACAIDKNLLGSNPLIAVVGHCNPGSSVIRGDDVTGLKFSVAQVLDVIKPLMVKNCTILLTPCSTAVKTQESPSFQDHLIGEIEGTSNTPVDVIGMNSTSLPVGGTVLTTGHTVKRANPSWLVAEKNARHVEEAKRILSRLGPLHPMQPIETLDDVIKRGGSL
jgi:hypothetical protein